jgi:hypothetical protein
MQKVLQEYSSRDTILLRKATGKQLYEPHGRSNLLKDGRLLNTDI